MIIRKEIDLNEPLTEEPKEMLTKMQSQEAVPDEDSPEVNYSATSNRASCFNDNGYYHIS